MCSASADPTELDTVTFEVLRHRLWAINDEQGLVAARMSGSPVVYEAFDFNSALLTASGDGLFVGVYVTRHAASIDSVVKNVLGRFPPAEIRDGDAFITNDPWSGAVHQNDFCVVAPIFVDDELLMWTGITMHDLDVGGPTPGGFTIGARDVYGEPPLIPPVKIVDGGGLRKDVAEVLARNTRTPDFNRLNLRARIAAINVSRRRLREVVGTYGRDGLLATQQRILETVGRTVRRRLESLPDGVWRAFDYIDHDGIHNDLYRVEVEMTKRGDSVTFDFSGCSPQARGSINCTRSGLAGGVMGAFFPLLCFDLPWSTAGLRDIVTVVSNEGSIVDARHPAGVSMASIETSWVVTNVCSVAIARMLACSDEFRDEVQACWMAGTNSYVIAYEGDGGSERTSLFMDGVAGGTGARSYRDGIDSGGYLSSAYVAMANVERNEQNYPVLELYRRHRPDSGGHGKFRGGLGIEYAIAPYGCSSPMDIVLVSHGASHPGATGVYGGLPGSVQAHMALRDTEIWELLRSGTLPADPGILGAKRVDLFEAKGRTQLGTDDVFVSFVSGGGGYGDPLARDVAYIARDVVEGLCDRERARATYGVVFGTGSTIPEIDATDRMRRELRLDRLRRGKFGSTEHIDPPSLAPSEGWKQIGSVGDALDIVQADGSLGLQCARCERWLGPSDQDPKCFSFVIEDPIQSISVLNKHGLVDEFVLRLFCCPGCGHLIGADTQRRSDPLFWDTRLHLSAKAEHS